MGIAFKELGESPHEWADKDGFHAERKILVAWENRIALLNAVCGGTNAGAFGGTGPASYPLASGIRAKSHDCTPFQKTPVNAVAFDDLTADLNSFTGQYALVTITYGMADAGDTPDSNDGSTPEHENGTILSYAMDFGGEYVVLPTIALEWEDDATVPVPDDAHPTKLVPIIEHKLTWSRVLYPPWTYIRSYSGKVNKALWFGADAETVLFTGARAQKEFLGFDDFDKPLMGWKIEYSFKEKRIKWTDGGGVDQIAGWNHVWRHGDFSPVWPGFYKLVEPISGEFIYQTADDFTNLLRYGKPTPSRARQIPDRP